MLLPGATLGVLGGGQLGRMFCVAARTMGYRTCVLDPDPQSPAGQIADQHLQADYIDHASLDKIAECCDAITIEFENIPAQTLRYLADKVTVYPSADCVEIAQNRIREKNFAQQAGLDTATFAAINHKDDLQLAASTVGFPAILKTTTLGYDGKGQYVVNDLEQAEAAFNKMQQVSCVLEEKLNLVSEISVLLARNLAGDVKAYPPAENEHRDGILHQSIVPARVSGILAEQARKQAIKLAEAISYVGVMAVEFFITDKQQLIFNEMAPRPHNSGHYTKDASVTSQFEQQVRVMCDMVPGDTRLLSPVVMVNLLGDLWPVNWLNLFQQPATKLHLYGKQEARPGRKMGHYNVLADRVDIAITTASSIFAHLSD